MTIFLSIILTVGYASVCCFFSAMAIGLWYGAYQFIFEGIKNLNKRGRVNKVVKVASMITMLSCVTLFTSANVFFWSRTGNVYRELRCTNTCN